MFKFLAKGLLRDRTRTLFPILIISGGVAITVLMYSWLNGLATMTIYENARFETGHVKVVTHAYAEEIDRKPFDLGILNVDELLTKLNREFPEIDWLPRIYFGGLLDIPDEKGSTKVQGEVFGIGIDLSVNSLEKDLLNLEKAIISGRLPTAPAEILISSGIVKKLDLKLNDKLTIISSTMFGSMSMMNFTFVGSIKFGIQALDKGAVIVNIGDAQLLLDMENAAAEILGFFPNMKYDEQLSYQMSRDFNEKYSSKNDEFSNLMLPLKEQNNLASLMALIEERMGLFVFIFIFIMSLVLWNSGLMNGIRRYGEIGVRLAIGESKSHIYRAMIFESLIIGLVATILGTCVGLLFSYYLQYKGIDTSSMMKDVSVIMSTRMKAEVNATSYYIGFVPGLIASVIGSIFSGIGIYRRKTAQLFKELET